MLEDYQINDNLRYEGHYLKVVDRDVQIGGVLASLYSTLHHTQSHVQSNRVRG